MKIAWKNLFLCTLFTTCVSGCNRENVKTGGYTHPDFTTEYSIEEHIERIKTRTEEKYSAEIASGELLSFEVEILYAFYDNDPEYFMVEFTYATEREVKEWDYPQTVYKSKYGHFIGYIQDDIYKIGIINYSGEDDLYIMPGRSAYSICGYDNAKKYYGGGVQAVETDEGIMQIYDSDGIGNTVEFGNQERFGERILSENEQEELMKANYKAIKREY